MLDGSSSIDDLSYAAIDHRVSLLLIFLPLSSTAAAEPEDNFDYFSANRIMIRNSVQAAHPHSHLVNRQEYRRKFDRHIG